MEEKHEEQDISEVLLKFLDAGSPEDKLDVLDRNRDAVDNRMLDFIAASLDTELPGEDAEERLRILRDHLITVSRFEGRRLRR